MILDTLKELRTLEKKIFDYFDYPGFSMTIDDDTNYLWRLRSKYIGFGEEDAETYQEQVLEEYRKDDYTLVKMYVNGDVILAVFDNAKEIKELDV